MIPYQLDPAVQQRIGEALHRVCGIYGFTGEKDPGFLERMGSVLLHRGPDEVGSVEFPSFSLGHRRLSIIDLKSGHQPMPNEDETVWLVFNGEVYNFRELRTDLIQAGHVFRTASDSEVIIHSYEEWGTACFERFNGMWALAIGDLKANKVVLARDHFGIKPLYYTRRPGRLSFASEIKALLQDPLVPAEADDQMVYEYLTEGLHDHREETFFKGVYHVMPATCVEIGLKDGSISTRTYWNPKLSEDGNADPAELHRLFQKAVERRLVSDVPVGSCLSGGLDSTAIVCLIRDLMKQDAPDAASLEGRLRTFSAVFDNDPIDEREYISVAAEASGAESTYIHPRSQEFAQELRDLIWHQEEPMVSTGPYAQWCVMREAKKQVTVLLDGQGGDELLAGYVPYQFVYLRQLWKERKIGRFMREAWAARDVLSPFLTRRLRQRRQRLSIKGMLKSDFVKASKDPGYGRSQDNLKQRLLKDLTVYSLPCLLRYEDRNSMAFSLESRIPYLDQEFVEWILRLPSQAIIHDGWSRAILREGLRGVIPDKIRKRRWKVGFTTPEMRWLKALRAQFLSLYRSPTFAGRPYWKADDVARAFLDACEGKTEESMFFWRAANVELWLREFIDRQPEATQNASSAPAPRVRGDVARLGDLLSVRLINTDKAWHAFATYPPNAGKHLFAQVGGTAYARIPVRTEVIHKGTDLSSLVKATLGNKVRQGDVVAISEKAVAISQGRSFPVSDIKTTWLARVLSKAVTRTPHGIGLGIPETMQLALNEVGPFRIVFAAGIAGFARLLGIKGVFYRIAGPAVECIDGPTSGTLPPYNKEASLGPDNPPHVAGTLAGLLGEGVGVAIVDANDLSVDVLGQSRGVDANLVRTLMRDNPLGQGHEQTPIAVLRAVGKPERA